MENENINEEINTNLEDINNIEAPEEPKLSPKEILQNQRYKQYAALAFIFAIAGYIFSCMCPFFGVVLAIVGLVFAIIARDARGKKHMLAIMAIIISIVAIITGISGVVANFITILFDDTFLETYKEMMNELQNEMQNAMENETNNLY